MTITCPHCKEENKVAGYYEPPADALSKKERAVPRCGFCGKPITSEERKQR